MKNKIKNKLKQTGGFSLVELIVVIAIMIILIAMLVPNVVGYISKATKATAQTASNEIYNAASVYITSEIGRGVSFVPNSTITPSVLWSPGVDLIHEPKNYEDIEIKVDDSGEAIAYVYFDSGTHKADTPQGVSGKVTE